MTGTVQQTLTDWLRQRLDADEAQLRPIADYCDCAVDGFPLEHGALCPARVLAEVESKRAIIDMHQEEPDSLVARSWCGQCDPEHLRSAIYPCRTLRLLALPYQGLPGWREEWRA